MNCDEMEPLRGAYLDSELDAKTTAEIHQHLTACADCARTFEADSRLNTQIAAALRHGPRTAVWWDPIERRIASTARSETRPLPVARLSPRLVRWRELLWPSPRAWTGLAALWAVMLAANVVTREPRTATEPPRPAMLSPSVLETLRQQRQMLAELVGMPEAARADQPLPAASPALQPRTQRYDSRLST
jgi:anti-sigma factor RsiW